MKLTPLFFIDIQDDAGHNMNYYFLNLVIHGVSIVRSTITSRGQTVIPATIRRRFHLGPSVRLEWTVDEKGIRVVPVAEDPVDAFRGCGKGGSTARLLQERQRDKYRE